MSSNGDFSKFGKVVDDYAELPADYQPPPPSEYDEEEGPEPIGYGPEADSRRRKRRQALLLSVVSVVIGVLIFIGSSFFWYIGLNRINEVKATNQTDPLQQLFEEGQRAYNVSSNLPETSRIMQDVLNQDSTNRFPVAALYIFAASAQQAQREVSANPAQAIKTYDTALQISSKYAPLDKLAAGDNARLAPPLPPGDLKSFDDWANRIANDRKKAQQYVDALSSENQLATTQNKEQAWNQVVKNWENLYALDPRFLIANGEDATAPGVAIKLIKAYLDRGLALCKINDVDAADKIAVDPKIKDSFSPRFLNLIKDRRADVEFKTKNGCK